jgi:phosphate/sulfate permease
VGSSFWEAMAGLPLANKIFFAVALAVAFGFEFINGFHDTANAVTTVIYTRTLRPIPAVLYSGVLNFLGVLLGGTAVAFSIVNLLPVDLLIESASVRAVVMVLSLLLAGVIWNLATWWLGLPVSSSHTLIGSILGVGLANSLLTRGDWRGVNWSKAVEVGLSLLISPALGFVAAAGLLLAMKRLLREPRLYHPPDEGDTPPRWVRGVLLATCGGVSLAHGSNDGQKGMGLILLALIGFLPTHYALDLNHPSRAREIRAAAVAIHGVLREREPESLTPAIRSDLDTIASALEGRTSFAEIPPPDRWEIRQAIYRLRRDLGRAGTTRAVREAIAPHAAQLDRAIEYVPTWVVFGVALALGGGTTIGYRRIVVTVAEKIGKTHMTYAQGAAAELVAAATIGLADVLHMPVSTTHVLASGVAGTMWANRSGIQGGTVRRIGLAWVLTLPAAIALSASLFSVGGLLIPAARPRAVAVSAPPAAVVARAAASGPLPRPVDGGHRLSAGAFPIGWRRPGLSLAEGARDEVVAPPGDGKQPPPAGRRPEALQLVVRREGQPAHPHPRPVADGAGQVQHIEPPAPPGDDILHAGQLARSGLPVQALVERPAQHAVDHHARRARPPGRQKGLGVVVADLGADVAVVGRRQQGTSADHDELGAAAVDRRVGLDDVQDGLIQVAVGPGPLPVEAIDQGP